MMKIQATITSEAGANGAGGRDGLAELSSVERAVYILTLGEADYSYIHTHGILGKRGGITKALGITGIHGINALGIA
jgi:hypothetical protein